MAEDNPVSQQVARKMLETLGCTVDLVGTGTEVLAAARHHRYGLIFMDCQMPGMDGYEATRALRAQEHSRHTPVVALTAGAMAGDAQRCFDAGMDAYLTKPVRLDDFAHILARWVPRAAEQTPDERVVADARRANDAEPSIPLIDLNAMSALHGDDTRSLVELFLVTSTGQLEEMRAAAATGDTRELQRLAHGLRGSALYLGAEQLARRCEELEQGIDRDVTDPQQQVEAIARAFRQVEDLLNRQFVG